jgi:ABC-type branched-subunit amino acid transport system ATPase component
MTALLEIIGLSKRFGGVQAVRDLSFTVDTGEIVGLIGPNGAGKSTVFDMINGVALPDTGRVLMEGGDVTGSSRGRSLAAASRAHTRSCSRSPA